MSDRQEYWDAVYSERESTELTWFQSHPEISLELIEESGLDPGDGVIDVGAGTSLLVDRLVKAGHTDVTALDLSPTAIDRSRVRLGVLGRKVTWVHADILEWRPQRTFALWHDRAVFHFLVDADARAAYLDNLTGGVGKDGHAVIATFGPEGPDVCSGLPVCRYDAAGLAETVRSAGRPVTLVAERVENHRTPDGGLQQYQFVLLGFD